VVLSASSLLRAVRSKFRRWAIGASRMRRAVAVGGLRPVPGIRTLLRALIAACSDRCGRGVCSVDGRIIRQFRRFGRAVKLT
jgi:hypothetical protein